MIFLGLVFAVFVSASPLIHPYSYDSSFSNLEKLQQGSIVRNNNLNSEFYAKAWIPKEKPVAAVLALHGLGEHISRYEDLFSTFKNEKILVLGFDLKGFGQTLVQDGNKKPGHLFYGDESFDSLREDIHFFWNGLDHILKDVQADNIPRYLASNFTN